MADKPTCLALAMVLIAFAGSAGARGPWRAGEGNSAGWQLMSPEERIEHQAKIRSFRRYEDCHAYQLAHHQLMAARASTQGRPLRGEGRDFCEHLRPPAANP